MKAEASPKLKDKEPALGSISLMPLPIEAQSLRSHALDLLVEGVHFLIVPRVLRLRRLAAAQFLAFFQRRVWCFQPWQPDFVVIIEMKARCRTEDRKPETRRAEADHRSSKNGLALQSGETSLLEPQKEATKCPFGNARRRLLEFWSSGGGWCMVSQKPDARCERRRWRVFSPCDPNAIGARDRG